MLATEYVITFHLGLFHHKATLVMSRNGQLNLKAILTSNLEIMDSILRILGCQNHENPQEESFDSTLACSI